MTTVLNDASGNPVAGLLTLYINGKVWGTSPPGTWGYSPWPGPEGSNNVTFAFNGTSAYLPVEAKTTVEVLPAHTTRTCPADGVTYKECFCPKAYPCSPYGYLPLRILDETSTSWIPSFCTLVNGVNASNPLNPDIPGSSICPQDGGGASWFWLLSGAYVEAGNQIAIQMTASGPVSFYLCDNYTYYSSTWVEPQTQSGDLVEESGITSYSNTVTVPVSTGWFFLLQNSNASRPINASLNVMWAPITFSSGTTTLSTTSSSTSSVHKNQAPSRITLQVPTVVNGHIGVNMSATLTGMAGDFSGGTMTWYLNGNETSGTLVHGSSPYVSHVSISSFQCYMFVGCHPPLVFSPGTYNITVAYSGDATYAPSRAQAVFVVLPDQTTTGPSPSTSSTYQSPSQSQPIVVQGQPITVQVDTLSLSLAIIAAALIIAAGIVLANGSRRRQPT